MASSPTPFLLIINSLMMKGLNATIALTCALLTMLCCSGSDEKEKETTPEAVYNRKGIWLWSTHLESADFKRLKECGIENIFLNDYAYTSLGEEKTAKRIAEAKAEGIRTHVWMQCFYSNDKWVNPVDTATGQYNQTLFNTIIDKAKAYAAMPNVAGIHLDYIRYPGTAYKTNYLSTTGVTGLSAVTEFTRQLVTAVKAVNSKVLVSAAVMGETSSNAYYYGQDTKEMCQYLDIIIPMLYRYNYKQTAEWIGKSAAWYAERSGNAEVWAGLQTYAGDANALQLLPAELETDCRSLTDSGAKGIVLFRYGLFSYLDISDILN